MDGSTLRTGAVGALQGFLHPVSVAREIMRRLPHELLVGDGAARFAREIGAETADNLIADSKRAWQAWFDAELTPEQTAAWPDVALAALCQHAIDPEVGRDTTVFLAQDSSGAICSGTSTSGWGWKYPGRLGGQPDHRGRVVCRYALRRGGLHRGGGDDDPLRHGAGNRFVHEERRLGRGCGA